MSKQLSEQLTGLIEAGKWDEVKTCLSDFFKPATSQSEKGALYTKLIGVYFDVATKINKEHCARLEEILAGFKQLQSAQSAVEDAFKLRQVEEKMRKAKDG